MVDTSEPSASWGRRQPVVSTPGGNVCHVKTFVPEGGGDIDVLNDSVYADVHAFDGHDDPIDDQALLVQDYLERHSGRLCV